MDGRSRESTRGRTRLRSSSRSERFRATSQPAKGPSGSWIVSAARSAIRLDGDGRVTARIQIASVPSFESPYPLAVAAGEGFVWVLNGNTATVTKIDPAQRTVVATIPIGIVRGPKRIAVGAGA